MLYLESPAGSGQSSGYSSCMKGGKQVPCQWDDVSQGEAYAHTLAAFFKAFPEYAKNSLYLTGESYFGQYGPNIANWILTHAPFNSTLNLKGILAGNACWGGDATSVNCNGPNEERNDVELFHGKGLISSKLYKEVYDACGWASPVGGFAARDARASCQSLVRDVHEAVGPHNIYFLYDNCPGAAEVQAKAGDDAMSAYDLKVALRQRLLPGRAEVSDAADAASISRAVSASSASIEKTGGYTWSCGGMDATSQWITTPAVRAALHLKSKSGSRFGYETSGPASITLWPFLAKHLRVLICACPPAAPLLTPRTYGTLLLKPRCMCACALVREQTMVMRTRACRTSETRSGSRPSKPMATSRRRTRGDRGTLARAAASRPRATSPRMTWPACLSRTSAS